MALPLYGRIDLNNWSLLAGKNPSFLEESDECFGGTFLHLATKLGHEQLVKEIIKNRPSLVSSTNSKGDTPIHLAARLGNTSILLLMLEFAALSTPLHIRTSDIESFEEIVPNDLILAAMVNKDGLTPLHCAAINVSIEILTAFINKAPSSFDSVTLQTGETVFHLAARHKKKEAFIFMAQSADLNGLLYKLDGEGNTVLHAAASVGFLSLVIYILQEIKMDVTTENNKGLKAVDFLNRDDEDFKELSVILRHDSEIFVHPSSPRDDHIRETKTEMENYEIHHEQGPLVTELKAEAVNLHNKDVKEFVILRGNDAQIDELPFVRSNIRTPETQSGRHSLTHDEQGFRLGDGRTPIKANEMQLEALQNARNTISVVAVLIASVAFTSGMNPPGGVYQEGDFIGKATAGRTVAFKVFSISNSIALFTSVSIVILLLSIIPFRTRTLKLFLVITHKMIWVAVIAMASAYVAAAWVTLPHSRGNKWVLNATLVVACVMLGGLFIFLWYKLASHMRKKSKMRQFRTSSLGTLDRGAAFTEGYYSM